MVGRSQLDSGVRLAEGSFIQVTLENTAYFIPMTAMFSKFALGKTSYSVTSCASHGFLMMIQRVVFCWWSSLIQQRHFAAQHPDASSSHPSHPLLSLLVHSQRHWLPGGQQMCMIEKEDWRQHIQMSGLPWIQRAESSLSPPSVFKCDLNTPVMSLLADNSSSWRTINARAWGEPEENVISDLKWRLCQLQ